MNGAFAATEWTRCTDLAALRHAGITHLLSITTDMEDQSPKRKGMAVQQICLDEEGLGVSEASLSRVCLEVVGGVRLLSYTALHYALPVH